MAAGSTVRIASKKRNIAWPREWYTEPLELKMLLLVSV